MHPLHRLAVFHPVLLGIVIVVVIIVIVWWWRRR